MIFGLLTGGVLRSARPSSEKLRLFVACGIGGLVLGTLLHVLGICPIVKRIWTPSWTVFSAGWVVLFLAAYYYAIDLKGYRRWTLPFVVVGMNSIAMYVLVHVAENYVARSFRIHLGAATFNAFGDVFAPVLLGASVLAVFWVILYWMYRRQIFVRI
jgi:predicted acyltransferase